MKHEWRKDEKDVYAPKTSPEIISIPQYHFLTIEGEGNPNSESFPEYISALYAVSYAVKMNLKKGHTARGHTDYTVYPLEGVWDLREEAKKDFNGILNKDDLIFKLMIRQPDFAEEYFVREMINETKKKKDFPLLEQLRFETITEGMCIQMLHIGSFDDEPESFARMEDFAEKNKFSRVSKIHREIYLSDFRKVSTAKLKTILRFGVHPKI